MPPADGEDKPYADAGRLPRATSPASSPTRGSRWWTQEPSEAPTEREHPRLLLVAGIRAMRQPPPGARKRSFGSHQPALEMGGLDHRRPAPSHGNQKRAAAAPAASRCARRAFSL
jgi:hypothetical protein